jgi:hypothetical protein
MEARERRSVLVHPGIVASGENFFGKGVPNFKLSALVSSALVVG